MGTSILKEITCELDVIILPVPFPRPLQLLSSKEDLLCTPGTNTIKALSNNNNDNNLHLQQHVQMNSLVEKDCQGFLAKIEHYENSSKFRILVCVGVLNNVLSFFTRFVLFWRYNIHKKRQFSQWCMHLFVRHKTKEIF